MEIFNVKISKKSTVSVKKLKIPKIKQEKINALYKK